MIEKILRIESDYFTAGVVFEFINDSWKVKKIAPIISYMRNWRCNQIVEYVEKKKFVISEL
jgi:hypothetical protein